MSQNHPQLDSHPRSGRIGAIVLGAGESRRLGTPKQLIRYDGTSLITHAVDCAVVSGCAPVIVVTGAYAERVTKELAVTSAQIVLNPQWPEGKGSSIRVGIQSIGRFPDLAGVVMLVCDQPFLTSDHIRALINRFQDGNCSIVVSAYADTVGIPALFSRALFPELLALCGDDGAKGIIARHGANVQAVEFPKGQFDIDTPQDCMSGTESEHSRQGD